MPLANARYGVTNSDTLHGWKRSGRCARGALNDDFGRVLVFYTVGVGLLDADWLLRVGCWTLIGWRLQRVTSLRHGALSCCRCKSAAARKRSSQLATGGLHENSKKLLPKER